MDDQYKMADKEHYSAAIHEASHVVVARHRGLTAGASVWRNNSGADEKAWIGQADFSGKVKTKRAWVEIGLAGEIGVLLFCEGTAMDLIRQEFEELTTASETDQEKFAGYNLADINRTVKILLSKKQMVLDMAAKLQQGNFGEITHEDFFPDV